jgi:hypothetical protein
VGCVQSVAICCRCLLLLLPPAASAAACCLPLMPLPLLLPTAEVLCSLAVALSVTVLMCRMPDSSAAPRRGQHWSLPVAETSTALIQFPHLLISLKSSNRFVYICRVFLFLARATSQHVSMDHYACSRFFFPTTPTVELIALSLHLHSIAEYGCHR